MSSNASKAATGSAGAGQTREAGDGVKVAASRDLGTTPDLGSSRANRLEESPPSTLYVVAEEPVLAD